MAPCPKIIELTCGPKFVKKNTKNPLNLYFFLIEVIAWQYSPKLEC